MLFTLCFCTDIRLVGGTSKCAGKLEMQHWGLEWGLEWRPVDDSDWTLKSSAVVCRQLDCGSAVSTKRSPGSTNEPVESMEGPCVGSESSLRECGITTSYTSTHRLEVVCSGNTQ